MWSLDVIVNYVAFLHVKGCHFLRPLWRGADGGSDAGRPAGVGVAAVALCPTIGFRLSSVSLLSSLKLLGQVPSFFLVIFQLNLNSCSSTTI